jgi:hypothetical protein
MSNPYDIPVGDEQEGITNEERAERGLDLIGHHIMRVGKLADDEAVTSILTDLMHFCDQNGIGFDECLDIAKEDFDGAK